ncbi:hypothetical protein AGMMS50225_28590 [Betaproteobacteria bacterium]|nr:hypothetical protein AGMMS50225_28590 [Betaproteobacteria bacterium]
MKHSITFFPVGNGDTSLITLANGKHILMDYRHQKKTEDGSCPEINLKDHLLKLLQDAKCPYLDAGRLHLNNIYCCSCATLYFICLNLL